MLANILSYRIEFIGLLLFAASFAFTYAIMPSILCVAKKKKLFDDPNDRSAHNQIVPTMGGVAFFITTIITLFFIKSWDSNNVGIVLLAPLTIIFFIGLKDDLIHIKPSIKLIAQFIATYFIISESNLQITNLHGFITLGELNIFVSYALSAFVVILIINSFNLIDGIDGLATIVGIIISGFFASFYYLLYDDYYFLLSLSLCASLLAFLRYNLSSKDKKIFMGDTGSLMLGLLFSILTLHLLATPTSNLSNLFITPSYAPLMISVLFIVPFFDTFRVFIIRVLNKKNPFTADKNHVHHVLINLGLSHIMSSLTLGIFNLVIMMVFFILSQYYQSYFISVLLFLGLVITLLYLLYCIEKNNTPPNL